MMHIFLKSATKKVVFKHEQDFIGSGSELLVLSTL